MSDVRPWEMRRARRGVSGAALLLAAAASVHHAPAALAQETSSLLRGEVSETAVNSVLLGDGSRPRVDGQTTASTQDGLPSQPYVPESQGATPDPDVQPQASDRPKSIFDEDRTDADQSAGTGVSAATPSTSVARTQARRQANAPAEDAATRLRTQRAARETAATADDADADTAGATDTTATVRAQPISAENELRTQSEQERAQAIEGLDRLPEDNPYAPVGIRVGTFVVTPTVETGLTWTSNADSSTSGKPALLSETTLRLNALSEWGGDRTSFDGYGNFRKTLSGEEISETRAALDASMQRDLGNEWAVLASLGYEVGPESASAPATITGTLDEPIKHDFAGSLGVEKDIGKLRLRLTGNVEREVYGDAELDNGETVSQSDRNSTLVAGVLRTGYELSPALTPFVEMEYGHRYYDEELDTNGYARSATRVGARGGLALNLSEKVTGEFSGGWIEERPEDDRLDAISGPSIAASLDWSPVRGTIVGLDATTTVEGGTGPGDSGSLLNSGLLTLSHELRANLTANLLFGAAYRDYTGQDGHDVILSAETNATWWLNRNVGITGKLRHEQQTSSLPGRDYTANSIFLGMKLQR